MAQFGIHHRLIPASLRTASAPSMSLSLTTVSPLELTEHVERRWPRTQALHVALVVLRCAARPTPALRVYEPTLAALDRPAEAALAQIKVHLLAT